MKKKYKPFLIIATVILLIYGGVSIFYNVVLLEDIYYKSYFVGVTHGETIYDVDFDNLKLGHIKPGDYISANITLENKMDYPIYVTIKQKGEMIEHITVVPNKLLILPSEETSSRFSFRPPLGTPEGDYSGELKIVLMRKIW